MERPSTRRLAARSNERASAAANGRDQQPAFALPRGGARRPGRPGSCAYARDDARARAAASSGMRSCACVRAPAGCCVGPCRCCCRGHVFPSAAASQLPGKRGGEGGRRGQHLVDADAVAKGGTPSVKLQRSENVLVLNPLIAPQRTSSPGAVSRITPEARSDCYAPPGCPQLACLAPHPSEERRGVGC